MYLYYRLARLGGGNVKDQLSWAVAITEKVNQISETPVGLWTSVFSPGAGTLVWTTAVEDLRVLESTWDKLLADDSYLDLVEQAAKWETAEGIEDGLLQILHGEAASAPTPSYTTIVRALMAPGQYSRGVEVGIELNQRAQAATGIAGDFAVAMTGDYGAVSWLAGYESIEQLQQAETALYADADFMSYLDGPAKDVFLAGRASQTIYRRMA